MKNPCHGCDRRTITCHGVCKEYEAWKKENEDRKEWLKNQRPIVNERAFKSQMKKSKIGHG